MRVLTSQEMAKWDQSTITDHKVSASVLMETAGRAVVTKIIEIYPQSKRFIILAGSGNNGGDGLVVARTLKALDLDVMVYILAKDRQALSPDCQHQQTLIEQTNCRFTWLHEMNWKNDFGDLLSTDIVIDAIFGTGFSMPIKGWRAEFIRAITPTPCPVVSIDIPSGLDPDKSIIPDIYFKADHTITFSALKACHIFFPATSACGHVHLAEIGLIGEPLSLAAQVIEPRFLPSLARQSNTHKYNYGHVLIIAGSTGMSGAAVLAAKGALASGAGLVSVFTPPDCVEIVAKQIPTALVNPLINFDIIVTYINAKKITSILVGPGLTESDGFNLIVTRLFDVALPLIIDATALNMVAAKLELQILIRERTSPTILTPHIGEASRLLSATSEAIQDNLIDSARTLANKLSSIAIIKGPRTVIALTDNKVWISTTGNPGMAKGGSGDVLAGILATLIHQLGPTEGIKLGCYSHGLAGDLAEGVVGDASLSPLDLIDYFPKALHAIQQCRLEYVPHLIQTL
jgi:NAD(P)H-hydrate epimerase